jgi:MFS family permease
VTETSSQHPEPQPLKFTHWLILVIAAIGFAFDTYELLMAPLVFPRAIPDLSGYAPGSEGFADWFGMLFYVPAFAGGIFGLLGGYLTDRLGRRRVLTWSILLYAFSAFAAGFATSMEMLLVLRCTTFIGVCVEFVAAVAWLAELFPNPHQREKILGYTQAFSSIGGLLVALVNSIIVQYARELPTIAFPESLAGLFGEVAEGNAPWRFTLMSGLIPAIPLIFIRPFLPESPIWARKKREGTLKRPSFRELFAPELRGTTVITTIMFACSYGAAFGAIQQIQRIVPGLEEVQEQARQDAQREVQLKQESGKKLEPKAEKILRTQVTKKTEQAIAANATKIQEVGGLLGRVVLAVLAMQIVSRRWLLRSFQWPGLIVMPIAFAYCATTSLTLLYVGIFLAGFFTVAQFSFWGNYLPRVYPVHLRGTGESFAANIGGRMVGTSFAWVTSKVAVMAFIPGSSSQVKLAYTAAAVGFLVYFVGSVCSFFLPEPKHEELPE